MSTFALFSVALIVVGLYGVAAKVNLLKVIVGIAILCLGVAGLVVGASVDGASVSGVSQAIGLVAIVGGASVVSLLIVTAVRLYEKYGTLDIREMRRLKG